MRDQVIPLEVDIMEIIIIITHTNQITDMDLHSEAKDFLEIHTFLTIIMETHVPEEDPDF